MIYDPETMMEDICRHVGYTRPGDPIYRRYMAEAILCRCLGYETGKEEPLIFVMLRNRAHYKKKQKTEIFTGVRKHGSLEKSLGAKFGNRPPKWERKQWGHTGL